MVREALEDLSPEELLAPPKPHRLVSLAHCAGSGRELLGIDESSATVDKGQLARTLRYAT